MIQCDSIGQRVLARPHTVYLLQIFILEMYAMSAPSHPTKRASNLTAR